MLADLADICADLGLYDESLEYCYKALKLYNEIPKSDLTEAKILKALGYNYTHKNNFEKARYYLEKSLGKITNAPIDSDLKKEMLSGIYAKLAFLYSTKYINKKDAFKGLEYSYKSLSIIDGDQIFYNKIKPSTHLAPGIARQKRTLGEAYCRLGEYDKAMKQGFQEAFYICNLFPDNHHLNLMRIQVSLGLGEIELRIGNIHKAEHILSESIKLAESLVGENYMLLPTAFRAEARIRLNNLDEAYKDCENIFNTQHRSHNNYVNLIYISCFYYAGLIKYKQNDLKRSIAHFNSFFKGIQGFCKDFLDEKDYEALETKGAFTINPYKDNQPKEDIKKYLKNSVKIFTTIYGKDHPFVKDYIGLNYKEAIKPWWKFW